MYRITESFRFVESEPKMIGIANTIEEAKEVIKKYITENYPEKISELSDLGPVNKERSKIKHVFGLIGARYLIELVD